MLNGVNGHYMGDAPGHVFISYVHEDRERVDRLQASATATRALPGAATVAADSRKAGHDTSASADTVGTPVGSQAAALLCAIYLDHRPA
jgi:hypothetical protein